MANKYRAWASGETLTAASLVDYVQKNVVIPCDSSSDYPDSSTRREGMIIYDLALDKLLVWSGTAWTPPWNMPWGVVGIGTATSAGPQTQTTNVGVDYPGLSVTWTAVAGRRYKTTVQMFAEGNTTGDTFNSLVTNSTASVSYQQCQVLISGYAYVTVHYSLIESNLSGSVTRKVQYGRATGTGWVAAQASVGFPAQIVVEDIGPA